MAAVVVIDRVVTGRARRHALLWGLIGFTVSIQAAVLPEDRADVLYHLYDGGGAEISGPSVLVRKSVNESVSVSANYYVDMVTSATIDVEAQGASEYKEKRNEYSLGVDYLYDKTILNLGYTRSSENDYEAETIGFGISQDFFGDLTTLSLGFTYGSDEVGKNETLNPNDPNAEPFHDTAKHRRYRLGISQILTKNLIVAANFETVLDEGYLNNPYRQVRALDPLTNFTTAIYQPEYYPRTRNSDAFSIRGLYYLPYRASLGIEYRRFGDSWGIQADSYQLSYTHPLPQYRIILEGKYRAYDQDQADFYSDLFPYPENPQDPIEFRARDKEMSEFSTQTFGFGASYEMPPDWIPLFEKSTLNLYWDHIQFDYNNFHDATATGYPLGEEPLYSFNANVIRLFVSFWY